MRVAMMLYAGFQLLEVCGPMDVFQDANRLWGGAFYEQHLVGPSPGPVLCSNGTAVRTTECLFDVLTPFDIVVVPGSPAGRVQSGPKTGRSPISTALDQAAVADASTRSVARCRVR